MPCDGPDDQPSIFLVQNIAEAEVMTLCLACMLDFAQGLLQQFAPERLAPPPKKATTKRRGQRAAAATETTEGGETNGQAGQAQAGTAQGVGGNS